MILRPMIPLVVLAGISVAVSLLCLRAATQQPRLPRQKRRWGVRACAFALLLLALTRPSFSGAPVPQTIEKADIFLVVDRSGSMSAEDFEQQRPRIEGVRRHLAQLAKRSSGARFSIVGFSSKAHIMLPLTDNTDALGSALEALDVEPTAASRGSSIAAGKPVLEKLLKRSKARDGRERRRFVVYVGDGEETTGESPRSFADLRKLVDGGLVLGYGTSGGGRMRQVSLLDSSETSFVTAADGAPVVSKIDESNLKKIAGDLGVSYHHMSPDSDVDRLSAKLRSSLRSTEEAGPRTSYRETYWGPMGAAALLIALELGMLSRRAAAARRSRSDAPL